MNLDALVPDLAMLLSPNRAPNAATTHYYDHVSRPRHWIQVPD
jgi:hypothetical protein